MPKKATIWTTNTQIGTVDTFDSSSSYDGGGTTSAYDSYDGVQAGLSSITTKLPVTWSGSLKTATTWDTNVLSKIGQRAYDSASTVYDSGALKYDGSSASKITTKLPTTWSTT